MKKMIRAWGLLALTVPLLGFAWPTAAGTVPGGSAPTAVTPRAAAPQQVAPVPCRCKPSVFLFGPFGCECPFDLLLSALKPGHCTPANLAPPCAQLTRCTVSLRLYWVGEDEGCEGPPKPLFAPMKASCGTFATQFFPCPAGPGVVTAFLTCQKCKP